jgi:hypothetical protein
MADASKCLVRRCRYEFVLDQDTFERIRIDSTKCLELYQDDGQIKTILQYSGGSLTTCEYDKYISHLLDYISGRETEIKFTKRNKFEMLALVELFKVKKVTFPYLARALKAAYYGPPVEKCR